MYSHDVVLTGAAQRAGGAQAVVASPAAVTAGPFNIQLTLTQTCAVVTPAPVHRPLRTAHTACSNNTSMLYKTIFCTFRILSSNMHAIVTFVLCFHPTEDPLTQAGIRAVHVAAGVGLVAWGTLVALWPCGVVQTSLTHTSTLPPAGLVHRRVEAAALSVAVTFTA